MTDETLAEILSGMHEPTSRADLRAMLDDLLDAAEEDGGRLGDPAFWAFMAALARGRGIAQGIGAAAAQHIAEAGGVPEIPLNDPAGATEAALAAARMAQWAMLSALLRRVTAFRGEILPREFRAVWFLAAADNIVAGRGEFRSGQHMDLLGLGTQRRTEDNATARAARRLLVGAVYYEAERSSRPVETVVPEMLDDLPIRTFQDWVRGSAKAQRIRPDEVANKPRSAAQGKGDHTTYQLSAERKRELLRVARPDKSGHDAL